MKVYKIRNEKNGTACIEKDISAVMCWVEEMYWNSELIIPVTNMIHYIKKKIAYDLRKLKQEK